MSAADRAAERLAVALDLYEAAEAIQRQNLRRRFPGDSPERIEKRLIEWLLTRRGAELGDTVGNLRPWPPPLRP
jgi:hypothetical protein